MSAQADLVRAIGATLRSDPQLSRTTRTAKEYDLYEVYLLSLVVRAARKHPGVSATFVRGDGSRPRELLFRRSPGAIHSKTTDFTHVVISSSKHQRDLEAHVGIYVAGRSEIAHECDVALLPARVAEACRRKRRDPHYSELKLGVEAKFVSARAVPLGYGRTFVGLAQEVRQPALMALAATKGGDTVLSLIDQHHGEHSRFFGDVEPGPSTPGAQALVGFVYEALRMWAR
jgi:hypothetical protein